MVYLDYAAATPLDQHVLRSMQPYLQDNFFNPSASYLAGQAVAKDLMQARLLVASQIGARPTEIIFTAGGTESDNLAIKGVMQQFPKAKLLVSAIEHHAVINSAQDYQHNLLPVNKAGLVDLAKLAKLVDNDTVLVSVMYANNEVGTIQPIRQISQLIKQLRHERQMAGNELPLYLHTDASQAANYLDLHISRLGVDMMTLNGGKIYGPKQTGVLFVKSGVSLKPQIFGGGQERGLRSGTENVAGSIGFAKALEIAQQERAGEVERLQNLQNYFTDQLQSLIPTAIFNGSKHKLPNNIHVTLPGIDNETVMMQLDEAGIMCAVGSACSASSDEPSHVLKAMGISDKEAQSSLRFSMGRQTTKKGIQTTLQAIQTIIG